MEILGTLEAVTETGTSARDTLKEALGFVVAGGDAGAGTTAAEQGAAASSELGTRENPIPVGEEAQVGPWKVNMTEVGANVNELVLNHNQFNDPPKPGMQYLLFTMEATRTAEEAAAFWVDMSCVFAGSRGNTFDSGYAVPPDSISDTGDAYQGASINGNLVFEVWSDQVVGGMVRMEELLSFEDTETFFAID